MEDISSFGEDEEKAIIDGNLIPRIVNIADCAVNCLYGRDLPQD